jgi:hypothetical protein
MLKALFLNFNHLFINLKECMVKENRTQSSEEVIADLHTYLENLNTKYADMESKIQRCNQKALYYKMQAQKEVTKSGRERELNRAKLFLMDKRRLQDEQDKAMKFTHVIRQQIDSLTASELDSIMVDAMRQYNMTATQMGLPDRTREIEELGSNLQERFSEATQLQQILGDATDPSVLATTLSRYDDEEDELAMELEALCTSQPSQVEKPQGKDIQETTPEHIPNKSEQASIVEEGSSSSPQSSTRILIAE